MHTPEERDGTGPIQRTEKSGENVLCFGVGLFPTGEFYGYLIKTFHFDQRCCFDFLDFFSMKYEAWESRKHVKCKQFTKRPKQNEA